MMQIFFILLSGMVIFGFSAIIFVLSPLMGMKSGFNMEKGSPFECGFDPMGAGHMDFSIRFFLIAIIFLIFDVEIAMLLPLYAITLSSLYKIWLACNFVFLVVLILGVFFEWKEGAFEWK